MLPHDRHIMNMQAIGIVCAAWLCFSMADATSKYLVQIQNYPVEMVLFINGAIGTALVTLWILIQSGRRGFKTDKLKWHVMRGFCITGTAFSVVHALDYLPLTDFYGISFLSPFFIAILSFLILKEHVGWHRWGAIAVGFIGVLILAQPDYEDLNIGLLWAAMVPVFISFNALLVRKIGPQEPKYLYAFFPFLIMMLFNGAIGYDNITMPDMQDAWRFIAVTLFVMGGWIGFAVGFAKVSESAVAAPFVYTQIIWGTLFGYFIFGDLPGMQTIAGLALIIGAGLYTIYREYKLKHET